MASRGVRANRATRWGANEIPQAEVLRGLYETSKVRHAQMCRVTSVVRKSRKSGMAAVAGWLLEWQWQSLNVRGRVTKKEEIQAQLKRSHEDDTT